MVIVVPRVTPLCPGGPHRKGMAMVDGAWNGAALLALPLVGRVAGRRKGSYGDRNPLPNPSPQGRGAPRTLTPAVIRRLLAVFLGLDPRMTGTELREMPGRAEGGAPRTWSDRL